MPSTTTAEKAELRRRARQYLRELSPQARRASDDALFARFLALPQVEAADTLLLYHGMGGEPSGHGGRRSACPAACRAAAWRPGLSGRTAR